jgi:hypothetical protein
MASKGRKHQRGNIAYSASLANNQHRINSGENRANGVRRISATRKGGWRKRERWRGMLAAGAI